MDILIIKTGAIGDVVRTTSILPGLKEKYKNSVITWVVSKRAFSILETNPLIDNILILENIGSVPNKFDLVINLEEGEAECDLIKDISEDRIFGAYLKNGKVVYSGSSNKWFDMGLLSRFGKDKADILKKENTFSYQKIISDSLGIKISRPVLCLTQKEKSFQRKFKKEKNISDKDFIICVATGAGDRWRHKRLSIGKTIELIKKVKNVFKAKIILLGSDKEIERNRTIAGETNVINGTGYSLMDDSAIIGLCDILITSDSLALHIGAALDKYIIAFFGPTSAPEIELYGKGEKIIPEIDCISCYLSDCNIRPVCVERLDMNEFINSIKRLHKKIKSCNNIVYKR